MMNIGRNDQCWCGSGKKYKKCHLSFDEKLETFIEQDYIVPTRDMIKNKEQIEGIKKCAEINNALLDLLESSVKEGMTTEEINTLANDFTYSHSAIPADLDYQGFPKSLCTSVNNEVCHGIPSEDVILKNGDIINVDVTTIFEGYYSDASRMFEIGSVSDDAKKLVKISKECLEKGIAAVKPWKSTIGDIGYAVQTHAESNGYSVVREFGGHGVGLAIHEEPFIAHFGDAGTDMLIVPGMVFTIEPMINAGKRDLFIDKSNGWTALTVDGSLSAQWEHTLLVTEDGVEILSK
ncbi:MAG: methionyl aminopeptidase [Tissierellales bacterium]|nr:methionyl aminopeptidase [Tissierellales bacterium]